MWVIFLLISLISSVFGAICGIGGGVIIKPVLDATGVLGVSQMSFLSGCTVLAMSIVSVFKNLQQKDSVINLRQCTALALGAAAGGIIGKYLFQYIYVICADQRTVGAIQAATLLIITVATLLYTIHKSKIITHNVTNFFISVLIGLSLGIISSFLGIGGGPINLVVLTFFFSMDTKTAAANSLYVILISQATSLFGSFVSGSVPDVRISYLLLMVAGGIIGGYLGSRINARMTSEKVSRLFIGMMAVIIFINLYNIIKFTLL